MRADDAVLSPWVRIHQWGARQWARAMAQRIPARAEQVLGQRQIFIVPNRYGLAFLGLILLIYVLGTNYQNNLMLGFAFWLLALFVLSILLTYHNLAGLRLQAGPVAMGWADDALTYHWYVKGQREHYGILIRAPEGAWQSLPHLAPSLRETVKVVQQVPRRGVYAAHRQRVESRFPFGWVTAWTYFQPEQTVIVWPKCRDHGRVSHAIGESSKTNLGPMPAREGWSAARPYQLGDTPRQVLWRHYVRRGELLVKAAEPQQRAPQHLTFATLEDMALEPALEQLAFWVHDSFVHDRPWSLRLDQEFIPLSCSLEHYHLSLTALARFRLQQEGLQHV